MSDIQEENKNIRIKQQRNKMLTRILICVFIILFLSLLYVYINKSASGTEIDVNTYVEQLQAGQVKEIYIKQSKIQIYYKNGEAHWFYNRPADEAFVVEQWNSLRESGASVPKLVFGTTTTISILNILYPVLILGSFIFMIIFISRMVRSSNNKNFDFVKSRARIFPSKTKFADVAGADEEKQELEDVVDFLKNPKKYTELGAKIPKGVILVGPPGTGKTLLARAVAGEADVPFFTISGSDFMELFVGVGASRVRDLFENAKKAKPCIIFIDEIDAVGRQRGAGLGGGNDEREQTLNQLLVQMDGFEENEGIIVMAATNRVDILDPALLRPGRFDRRININLPDIKGREEILKVHAKNKKFDKKVSFKTIARLTSGFTGAELENLLNEAAIMVAKENRKQINETDIQKAMMKVSLGPQKRSRIIDDKDKFDTAIHESGHALISRLAKEKSPVHEVSIIPRGGAGGYTLSTDDDSTVYFKEKLLCKIQMLLGGITAEKLYVGDISTGASNDLKRASSIARRMVTEWGMSNSVGMVYCGSDDEIFVGKSYQERMPYSETQGTLIDEEIKKIIDECQKITEKILIDNKDALMTMSNILLEKETIYSEEVDMIIAGKSEEEVLEFMEREDRSQTFDKWIKAKENANFVDELLKTAENREKESTGGNETENNETNQPKDDKTVSETNNDSKNEEQVEKTSDNESELSQNPETSDNNVSQETIDSETENNNTDIAENKTETEILNKSIETEKENNDSLDNQLTENNSVKDQDLNDESLKETENNKELEETEINEAKQTSKRGRKPKTENVSQETLKSDTENAKKDSDSSNSEDK